MLVKEFGFDYKEREESIKNTKDNDKKEDAKDKDAKDKDDR